MKGAGNNNFLGELFCPFGFGGGGGVKIINGGWKKILLKSRHIFWGWRAERVKGIYIYEDVIVNHNETSPML